MSDREVTIDVARFFDELGVADRASMTGVAKWIVVDRPYYPWVVDEVDTLDEALTIAKDEASDSNPEGTYDNRVIVAKIETTLPFKDFY